MADSPLKLARESAGLSRKELAARLGITYSTLADREDGRRAVSLDWLYDAAAAMGCRPSDLDPRLTRDRPKRVTA